MIKRGDIDIPDYISYHSAGPEDAEEYEIYTRLKLRYIRSVLAFWLLGMCNQFGVYAMFSAAPMILDEYAEPHENEDGSRSGYKRDCAEESTALIIVYQFAASAVATLITPFIPMLIHCRMGTCIAMYIGGFVLVACTYDSEMLAMFGITLVALSGAIGETSILQYSAYFARGALSTFSSGTGGAGIVAALSFTLGMGKGYRYTMLAMTAIPILMGFVFWIVLPIPTEDDKQSVAVQKAYNEHELQHPWEALKKKAFLIPRVFYKYIAPLGLNYIALYYINMGLYELIVVRDSSIDKNMQYQWLQVAFQFGVFVARSSVNFLYIKNLWLLALGQSLNAILFTTIAIYQYIHHYWILILLAIEEGLFGGACYVNTFVKIGREEEELQKQFMSSMTCFGLNLAICVSGIVALGVHELICRLPPHD